MSPMTRQCLKLLLKVQQQGATAAALAGTAHMDMANAQDSANPVAEAAEAFLAEPLAAAALLEPASNPEGATVTD